MSITKIPLQEPAPPPSPKAREAEQLGLYDAGEWESAYRDLHRVPHLLIQLQDDLARSRRRESLWLSVLTHLLVLFILLNWEKLDLGRFFPRHAVVALSPNALKDKNLTYLDLPPDAQKLERKPNTNRISDKDRIATSRNPQLDPKELRKLLGPPPGRPGVQAPPAQPATQPSPPAAAQNQPPAPPSPQPQQEAPRAPSDPSQVAKLQTPTRPKTPDPFKTGPVSVGSAIQEAARAAAGSRGSSAGDNGDFGLGQGKHGRETTSPFEILSDTQGVDFGPYLKRILHDIRENWVRGIPESAEMKKGNLGIEFAILKDGSVAGMKLVASSGDVALDRAAWGGITASNPLPALPSEFPGTFLSLRIRFYYNEEVDLE